MARPSGLASDHHPEGPGDAPRRRRTPKGTPSADVPSGSKRAASPTVEQSPQPKRKRVSDVHDQLAREVEESAIREVTVARHGRRNSEPVVAFADDEESDEEATQQTPVASTQPLPGLTPHLQRIGAPRGRPTNAARRARMSVPAQFHRLESIDESGGSQIQFAPFKATIDSRTRRRLKRNHLAEEYNDLEDHQKEDRKLRKAYIELSKQLKDKSSQIQDLERQLEERRLGEINLTDDETDDLRQKLSQAQAEIEELRASSVYRGEEDSRETSAYDTGFDGAFDDDDDEPLLGIDPTDPDGPDEEDTQPLPNGEYAERMQMISSQMTLGSLRTLTQTSHDTLTEDPASIPEKIPDQAVKRYEKEIERLVENLAESQGALRLLTIELQNMSILPPGATGDQILEELRHTFEAVREEMENLIPGCSAELSNREFLRTLPERFEGLLSELLDKTQQAEKYYKEARTLRSQYENSLNLLERSDARNEVLDAKFADLERGNEALQTQIDELEERVVTLDKLTNEQDADIKQKDIKIHGLEDELEDKETALTRLRDSLQKYRDDLDNVTETATRAEAELQKTIAELEAVHAAEVLALQTQIQDENEARLQAQGEAEQKSEYIEELEQTIHSIENQVTALTEDLEQLRDRLATETQDHDQTKAILGDEQERLYAQQNEIENLKEDIEQLENDLADARANLEAEKTQREETEAALEEANTKVEELQERLGEAGMESQNLRSKLFEAQMQKEEVTKQIEAEAREHETSLQETLDTETEARQAAEQTVADLSLRVTQLEEDIVARDEEVARLTQELADVEKQRDEYIADLQAQVAALEQKLTALENTSASTITTLQSNITDLTNEVNALKASYEQVTTQATENERDLREQLAQMGQELAEKDQRLADVEEKYAQLDEEHTQAIENFSVEQLSFNKLQQKWIRGQATMEEKIKALDAKIRDQEAAAAQAVRDHEAAIAAKETEIQDLRIIGDVRAAAIVEKEAQIAELKESFEQQTLDTQESITKYLEAQDALHAQNRELAAELLKRNADTNQAVQAMHTKGVVVKSKNTNLNKVSSGKITKVSERVRVGKKGRGFVKDRKWRDSGFGADSDIENEEEEFDEVVPEAIVA